MFLHSHSKDSDCLSLLGHGTHPTGKDSNIAELRSGVESNLGGG